MFTTANSEVDMQRGTKPSANSFARANHQQIREQQAINDERKRQDAFDKEKKAQLIARQKAHYGANDSHRGAPPPARRAPAQDDVEITVFVRECDPDAHTWGIFESQATTQQPKPQEPLGRRAPAVAQDNSRRMSAGRAAPQMAPAPTPTPSQTPAGRGEVPAYLRQRQQEMAERKAEASRVADIQAEQAKYPPGHRPVSDEERREILNKLAQRKQELEHDIGHLPMRFDNASVRQRRQQFEAELQEVEQAERKFSVNKPLFVPI
jgi:hypothetical protein